MDFRQFWDGHIAVFYILGFSSFNPRPSRTKHSKWIEALLKYLPTFLLLLLTASVSSYAIFRNTNAIRYRRYLGFTYSTTMSTTILVAIVTSMNQRQLVPAIYQELRSIEFFLRYKCQSTTDFFPLARIYWLKVTAVLFVLGCAWFGKWYFHSFKSDLETECALMALLILATIPVFHAVFYISTLRGLLKVLSDQMEFTEESGVNNLDNMNTKMIIKLRVSRRIHLRLWKCSFMINQYFGWSFVAMLSLNFYLAVLALYWVFVYTVEPISLTPFGFIRN